MSIARSRHLKQLESEAIYIMREVVARFRRPVMLYSIGKDSAVMLHLALKAFYPDKPPFPLLHVDTTWKFKEMITFRDETAKRSGMDLIVHSNADAVAAGVSPLTHDTSSYTRIMKTDALKQALDLHEFDAAFGGARRDEEKSRAKERIFSVRSADHGWDPRNQRPEFRHLFNCCISKGQSVRVFPLSNWTESDVWHYILVEDIPVVSLYFSAPRPVVARDNSLIVKDDERLVLRPGEHVETMNVRFRTLGCYPLTSAMPSTASSVEEVIEEMRKLPTSERAGRLIDHDQLAAMEKKKKEGYF